MPATFHAIRSALKVCCIAFVPLLAACGGGGDGGPSISLALREINVPLNAPLFVTAPPSDFSRLFVVEQGGTIKIVNRNPPNALVGTFLDISSLVDTGGEAGLHGLAFDPGYATNGRFYVSYTNVDGNTVVARYQVSGNPDVAQPTGVILMTVEASGQHFGGMLAFGPNDGFLYVSRGDGGPAPDVFNRAQNLGALQGKILRLDVSGGTAQVAPGNPFVGQAGALGEIWSYGLRNPWRFSFDRQTGDLYIADVGQDFVEEVNVATVAGGAGRGANFGWKIMEGSHCFPPGTACNMSGLTQPTVDYTHPAENCGGSITGGYVYRGSAIPALRGTYFYGDFCKGFVRSFRFNGQAREQTEWPSLARSFISSFGEDAAGELYITTITGGLFRIVQ